MTLSIHEPAREVPVTGEFDVVVAGGGIAGVAAAVAAARNGATVCLLDKESALGGLATLGNVIIWLPICDGRGRQVIGGLGEELLRLSVQELGKDDPAAYFRRVPACWEPGGDPAERRHKRFQAEFNPASYFFALEKWVTAAGVTLSYDTRVCDVRRENDVLTHVLVENKSGRTAIAGKTFVDATGDADLCHFAGEATESLDSNVLCGWYYYLREGKLHLKQCTHPYSPRLTREGGAGPFFRGDDGRQVTDMILGSRELVRRDLAAIRARHPGEEVQLFAPTTIACFRASRRLVGALSLAETQVHEWFDDTVGLTGDWRQAGPVYALPLRTLCGVRNRNLLAAGRCISAEAAVWDVTRAIPGCAVTGEAAGTAAALAAQGAAGAVAGVDIRRLQDQLRRQRGLLDPALVKPVA